MIAYNTYICEAYTFKAVCYTIITVLRRKQKWNSTPKLVKK